MNLFIVENSNYLCERLSRLVARRDDVHVVGHAATALEAVNGVRTLKPDVVLLDIRLDQGTGMDVLKQIKLRGQPPAVIVLTNYAYPQYRDRFLANGADYFFDKSAELDLMLQALDLLHYRFPSTPSGNGESDSHGKAETRSRVGGKNAQQSNLSIQTHV